MTGTPADWTSLTCWLDLALRDLAPAAQDRVRGEYRAHVQDATTSGLTEAQAVATLGDPAQVNRALRRTYATASELDIRPGNRTWGVMLGVMILYAAANLFFLADDFDSAVAPMTGSLTALGLTWPLWRLTRAQPRPVRNFLLDQGAVWLVNFSLWLGWAVQAWRGDPPAFQAILWLLPVLWTGWMVDTGQKTRRMRRTLNLSGQA